MATKTLRVTLADILGVAGPAGRVKGEVWARFVDGTGAPREVRYTDGTVVTIARPRVPLNASGVADFVVVPNNDATVHVDDQGFGIQVGWDLESRGEHGRPEQIKNTGKTVAVTSSSPSVAQYGLLASYVPVIAGTSYITQGTADAAYGKRFQINVADFGATGNGSTDDTTAIVSAIGALVAGARLYFPPGTYKISAALQITLDRIHIDAFGANFVQTTWATACFDLLGANRCKVQVGKATFTGTRSGVGSSFRGSSGYCFGNVVWANGDFNTIEIRETAGLPVPVFLSSWNGTGTYDRQGDGNTLNLGDVAGANFGVLYSWQKNLTIILGNVHDDIDDSAGANPTHAIYGSGDATHRSSNVKVVRAHAQNILNGCAYQMKYSDLATISQVTADNTKGFANIMDCDYLNWEGGSATGQLNTGGSAGISFGYTTAPSKKPVITGVSVALAASNDERAVSIWADDAKIDGLAVEVSHSGSVTTTINDVVLRGSRGSATDVSIRSVGAGHARGITAGFGTDTVTDWVIKNPVVRGARSIVDVLGGSTGVRVDVDVAASTLTGAAAPVGVNGGTATGSEFSLVIPAQVFLSTLGDNPAIAAIMAGSTVIVPVANNGIQCLVTPRQDIAVTNLLWFSSTASGNYDIAIVDDALATRLWSKGSTAWPAAGTITETVTGVTLKAGRTYRLVFSADNTTGALRGATASAVDTLTRLDGLFAAYLTSSLFPVGSTPARGSTGSTRVPLIIVKGT